MEIKYFKDTAYEIVVIGAGHAGIEAALAASRLGHKTLILTMDLNNIGDLPCNPNIGGTGKGHLVREIDALGGEMAINIDKSFIQSRMLNTSKGLPLLCPLPHRSAPTEDWQPKNLYKSL